jgi:hypothetical protein
MIVQLSETGQSIVLLVTPIRHRFLTQLASASYGIGHFSKWARCSAMA